MKYARLLLWAGLAGMLVLPSAADAAGRARQTKASQEAPSRRENPERAIANVVRQMQMDLEASSRQGVLSHIDSAKFDDYPRFEDMIERLTREDTLRVFFRQVNNSIKEESAQTVIDAEMEMTRKDSAGQLERRRQQLVIDFQRTSRGWKITNITPREFFRPL